MSATDTAKEIIRIGSTAGLSKDVIDLLEKKLVLLTEQVALLTSENMQLKLENGQLRTQLKNSQPVAGGFHEFGGILWKRTSNGFEPFPYCKECDNHPVMFGQPPHPLRQNPMLWQCSKCGFIANFAGRPKI
jgi:hypothetical protein